MKALSAKYRVVLAILLSGVIALAPAAQSDVVKVSDIRVEKSPSATKYVAFIARSMCFNADPNGIFFTANVMGVSLRTRASTKGSVSNSMSILWSTQKNSMTSLSGVSRKSTETFVVKASYILRFFGESSVARRNTVGRFLPVRCFACFFAANRPTLPPPSPNGLRVPVSYDP